MAVEIPLLGQQVEYPTCYDPAILTPLSRVPNREQYAITSPESLFLGYDTWHAYEAGFLTCRGLPVTGILKIVYPSSSPFLIESKSLKLYLNSYNMTMLGESTQEGEACFVQKVQNDLTQALHTPVDVHFFKSGTKTYLSDFDNYTIIEAESEVRNSRFTEYRENPGLLTEAVQPGKEITVGSHLLRSNCKVTGQPDWGSVYIRLKAKQLPTSVSLLKYIVSLRHENHFHEEICEILFKRLWDTFSPEILSVSCLYTRRGGIDICPSRANRETYLPPFLHAPSKLTQREFRQ